MIGPWLQDMEVQQKYNIPEGDRSIHGCMEKCGLDIMKMHQKFTIKFGFFNFRNNKAEGKPARGMHSSIGNQHAFCSLCVFIGDIGHLCKGKTHQRNTAHQNSIFVQIFLRFTEMNVFIACQKCFIGIFLVENFVILFGGRDYNYFL